MHEWKNMNIFILFGTVAPIVQQGRKHQIIHVKPVPPKLFLYYIHSARFLTLFHMFLLFSKLRGPRTEYNPLTTGIVTSSYPYLSLHGNLLDSRFIVVFMKLFGFLDSINHQQVPTQSINNNKNPRENKSKNWEMVGSQFNSLDVCRIIEIIILFFFSMKKEHETRHKKIIIFMKLWIIRFNKISLVPTQ